MQPDNVLLPFMAPTTKSLREAVRNIILDIHRATNPKARMDALPACKAAMDALANFVTTTERERLRLVS